MRQGTWEPALPRHLRLHANGSALTCDAECARLRWPPAMNRSAHLPRLRDRNDACGGYAPLAWRGARPRGRAEHATLLLRIQRDVAAFVRHRDAVQEARQLPRAHRMPQLAHGLGFDLPHALARDAEDPAPFLQRV